jgi:hypothetical protein
MCRSRSLVLLRAPLPEPHGGELPVGRCHAEDLRPACLRCQIDGDAREHQRCQGEGNERAAGRACDSDQRGGEGGSKSDQRTDDRLPTSRNAFLAHGAEDNPQLHAGVEDRGVRVVQHDPPVPDGGPPVTSTLGGNVTVPRSQPLQWDYHFPRYHSPRLRRDRRCGGARHSDG